MKTFDQIHDECQADARAVVRGDECVALRASHAELVTTMKDVKGYMVDVGIGPEDADLYNAVCAALANASKVAP